ncbi:DUF4199 domain-containing protein [Seonamhaeicola sp. MEBiC1930]|uniref:DUF4199 domain-containing protein n=1 Tax=Seonamhaeicola sp. MEBiC01930 TaxID=2976768 RepID=UPI0032475871
MEKTLKSIAINYGLYLGLILSGATAIAYAVNVGLFANMWFGITLLIVIIIMGIISVAKVKQAQNGYATFKEAFTAFFITSLIAIIISSAVSFLIFNVIDPDAADTLKEITIEKTVEMLEKFNAPADSIAKSVEQIETQNQFSILNVLKSLFFNLIFYIIIGLIVAAAMKKSKPETE